MKQFDDAPTRQYKQGEIIYNSDAPAINAHCSEYGYVKYYALAEDGRQNNYNIARPKTIFPFNLIGRNFSNKKIQKGVYNPVLYEAMSDIDVKEVPIETFIDTIKKDSEMLRSIMSQMTFEIELYMRRLDNISQPDAYRRVAFLLFELSHKFDDNNFTKNVVIEAPITHQDIADMTSITRETATREVTKLKNNGLIYVDSGKFVVVDLRKLGELII